MTLELNPQPLPCLIDMVFLSKGLTSNEEPNNTIAFAVVDPYSTVRAWLDNSQLAQYNTLSTLKYYYYEYGNKLTQGHQAVKRHQIGDKYQPVCPFKNKITSNKYYYELKRKSVSICGK